MAVPATFDDWVTEFEAWQDRVGFDASWLGDYEFEIKFDWDNVSDTIEFGDYTGRPKWMKERHIPRQDIRDALVHLISVQGDTEFASTEQQRHLLSTAPTEYDRKAALRIMAEEQRHGWQMAYLLVEYFGKAGAREAQKLLERDALEGTRLLGSFNQKMDHWLDFFTYTMFVDRDGKYQLKMLSTSSFKPLASSMGPMLKEESFHLGTGANGLRRIIKQGVIPLPLIQNYFNKWIPTAYDLFGVDDSSSAEWAYVWGLKGRYDEATTDDEVNKRELNQRARQQYHDDIATEVERFNTLIPEGAAPLFLPAFNFQRGLGVHRGERNHVTGEPFAGSDAEWATYLDSVLPTETDLAELDVLFQQEWIEHKGA